MSELISPDLRQILAAHPGEPIEFIDEQSHTKYVMIPVETFERIKSLLTSDEFNLTESYAAQNESLAAAGWNDDELDIYNHLKRASE